MKFICTSTSTLTLMCVHVQQFSVNSTIGKIINCLKASWFSSLYPHMNTCMYYIVIGSGNNIPTGHGRLHHHQNQPHYSPRFSIPIRNCTNPLSKVKATAFLTFISTGWFTLVAFDAVSSDIMAVGPRVISLDVPNMVYTKHPMNAEYRPYCTREQKKFFFFSCWDTHLKW